MWLWPLAFRRAHRDRDICHLWKYCGSAPASTMHHISVLPAAGRYKAVLWVCNMCVSKSCADPLFVWSLHRQHFCKCARQQKCIHFCWQQCQRTKHKIVTSSPVPNARLVRSQATIPVYITDTNAVTSVSRISFATVGPSDAQFTVRWGQDTSLVQFCTKD
jgi:hypothetical protein